MSYTTRKDGGWAWIITLASFIAMTLETGTVKALGVMLPTLRQQFSTPTWVIGLSISLTPGFGAVTCPFAGALSKRFTARHTVMSFSLFSVIGLIMASLATSVHVLMVALLLTGFSLGAEAVILGEQAIYFEKHYDLSIAIAQAGLSIGVMLMPPVTQLFLDIYGWRGTLLLLAGLNLHLIMCGALLRPLQVDVVGFEDTDKDLREHDKISSIKHYSKIHSVLIGLVHYLDLTLFTDVRFLSHLIYNVGSGYCFTGWLIYLVPHARNLDFQTYESSFLATIGGIGNLLASILYPILKIYIPDTLTMYLTTLMMTFALGLDPLVSRYHSYIGLAFLSGMFVLARGMAILSVYKLVKNAVEDDKLTNAMLWINVAYSVGAIGSGFLSGWTFDQTGDFVLSFLMLSGISLLAICPQFILDIKDAWKARKYASLQNGKQFLSW